MLRCLAIDDESLALELLVDNISKVPYLQLAGACHNPLEAMQVVQQQKIDLVFLDIQMPGLTGLQLIQTLSHKPLFILVTAYADYALQGFELDVVDYLLKPVAFDRFLKACNRALEQHEAKTAAAEKTANVPSDFLFVPADYSHVKVVLSDIRWIEGLKDYLRIHLKGDARPVVTRMSMKSMEEQLPPSIFIRIQKSYIVSKQYITAVRKNSVFLDALELPVGDQYKEAVAGLLGKATG